MNTITTLSAHVSILLPSYNYAHYMTETIESIFAQDYPYWELIIIEDGSTDNSLEVAMSFAEKDDRIQVVLHENGANRGLSASLQLGLAKAQYPYVAFLEADDMWKPTSLSERMALFLQTNASLVFSDVHHLLEGKRNLTELQEFQNILEKINHKRPTTQVLLTETLAMNLIPTFSSVIIKRDVLKKCNFAPPYAPLLDKWLWQQACLHGRCLYLPKALTLWRIHEESYIARSKKHHTKTFQSHWDKASIKNLWEQANPCPPFWLYLAKIHPHFFCYLLRGILRTKASGWKFIFDKLRRVFFN